MRTSLKLLSITAISGLLLSGCGESGNAPLNPTTSNGNSDPTLAIPGPEGLEVNLGEESNGSDITSEEGLPEPTAGTPEWSLREIAVLRNTPTVSESETDPISDAEIRQREINKENKIVSLATSVIAATHKSADQERLFNAGVHALTEARLNLSIKGDQEQIDAMYDDAASLFKRDPKSIAAVTAASGLIRLAEAYTERIPSSESWRNEYVKQVKLFAKSFPQEESRAVVGLTTAGQLCEDNGQIPQAVECFRIIVERFPNNAFASQAQATLRRLQLPGKAIELAGPTIDGGFISMDDLAKKTVLVMFWSASSESFTKDWPAINAVYEKHQQQGFEIVGVNLDKNEIEVDKFLEQHAVKGRHIFYLQESKRGLSNPIARYYDVTTLPTYWLIQGGKVTSTTIQPEGLDSVLSQIAGAKATAAK